MTKKSDLVQKLLKKIEPRRPLPKPMSEANLLEHGMLTVLVRYMPQERAEAALATLRKAYPDWNEMRVAQTQEIAAQLLSRGRKASRDSIQAALPAAFAAREYLQEVFQKTHSLDLEFLREDMASAGKLVQQMPLLGLAGGSYLLWLAGDRQLPVHGALVRVLDRLGLIARTASMKKARDLIDPLVTSGEELAFVAAFGEVADRWCLPHKPICQECVLVEDCVYGRKAFQEWKVQQVRIEALRVKDEARRALVEKKDEARRQREDARAKKRAEAEAQKRERERKRLDAIAAKQRAHQAAQQAKLAAQQKKAAAEALAAEKAAKAKAARKPAPARRGALEALGGKSAKSAAHGKGARSSKSKAKVKSLVTLKLKKPAAKARARVKVKSIKAAPKPARRGR